MYQRPPARVKTFVFSAADLDSDSATEVCPRGISDVRERS